MSYPDSIAPDQGIVFWHLVTSTSESSKTFPPPHLHRLRAVATLNLWGSGEVCEVQVQESVNEATLVRGFLQELDLAGDPVYVGLTNFHFGNAVVISAAMRHGLILPRQFTQFNHPRCEDVSAWVKDFTGNGRGFEAVTSLLNLPARPQLDISKLLLRGKLTKVLARLRLDVGIVALAWTRMALVRGLLPSKRQADVVKQIWTRMLVTKSALVRKYFKQAVAMAKEQKENRS